LKSFFSTPSDLSQTPAGTSRRSPAGEMWSVVIESPNMPSTRAPAIGCTPGGVIVMPSKYGGCFTYVDLSSHA
jgi:hypothetical protein